MHVTCMSHASKAQPDGPSPCSTVFVTRHLRWSSYGSLAAERCVSAHSCTLGMSTHNGINVRDRLQGLNLAFGGCGLTPHAVCVTVHGKKCSSGPEGDAAGAGCVSSGEAQPCVWTCSDKSSAPFCPLQLMGVRSIESQWPPTRTVSPKLPFSPACNVVFYFFIMWKP